MTDENLAFWDMQALFWDQFVRPRPHDVAFFVSQAQQAGSPVLEIGCGTGRSLIPIAEAGISVVGLDLSGAMLAHARRKAALLDPAVQQQITLVQADMRQFALHQRFNLILMTYTFVFLMTAAEQRQALAGIAAHLAEGGRLIITNPDPQADIIAAHLGPLGTALKEPKVVEDPVTKQRVLVRSGREYDPLQQQIKSTFVFERLDSAGEVQSRQVKQLHSRYTYRYELEHLLELAGYEVEALYGDFQGKPFKAGDIQIWVLSKIKAG